MNETWESMIQTAGGGTLKPVPPILAQGGVAQQTGNYLQQIFGQLSEFVPNLLGALAILIVGIVIALIVSKVIKAVLNRTSIDNTIAGWITGGQEGAEGPQVEQWISGAVFWIIIIFTVVATLQNLQLQVISQPLNNFLNQIFVYLPQIVAAAVLLAVAWLVATIVKLITVRVLRAAGLDERFSQQVGGGSQGQSSSGGSTSRGGGPQGQSSSGSSTSGGGGSTNQFSLSETIGSVLYWFVFLLFLPAILSTLNLQGILAPVQELVNEVLAYLPNLLSAILIAFAGWVVARVISRIVVNLLAAAGTDRVGSRFGLGGTGSQSLSWIMGTIVYVLILIPVAIAALQASQINAIADPAIAMLNQILVILPNIFTALGILILGYVAGKYISEFVADILAGFGFNNVFQWVGMRSPLPTSRPEGETPRGTEARTPSELMGIIVWAGIVLFATLSAVEIIQIPALTQLVNGVIVIAGQVLVGLIVLAVGLFFAQLAFNLIVSAGTSQSRILGQVARIAIIAFSVALGLQQMGIGSNIINLAFGLLLGAIAVAIALAFGLGARDIAAEQVREWLDSFKRKQ
ncbi:MAG: hypothetical protein BRC40_14090 [Cyanobacteria bacterium QH_8_48_120]|jgi:hypothetical protein|nr:MAG: hypothetical protein BRC34_15245 [Cyanobacteria bacterium QH_1_48_107]PSO69977.1 MAG: hypothetical protein BRC40_14090 [Cyanobacteria bacterium QH_8_48_120]PSP13653.1 MAG: hypothetical protein BRC50_06120 [Cyanobacteria bacterium SW_11_48_12]